MITPSLKQALKSLLASGFSGTQKELCGRLQSLGIRTDQSTVSRALAQLGAKKQTIDNRRIYQLPAAGDRATSVTPSLLGLKLEDIILTIANNESIVVVKTVPGAAQLVASIVDHKFRDLAIGTVAGDDSLLVVPSRVALIPRLVAEMEKFCGK